MVIDLDELESLARAAGGDPWCLHPNGTSVWTGEEYTGELVPDQHFVCSGGPVDDSTVDRLSFIAALSPEVVLELIERARGKKTIDQLIDASSLGTPEAKAMRAQAPPTAVERVLNHAERLYELTELRRKACQLARVVLECDVEHSACRTSRVPHSVVMVAKSLLGKT